MNSVIISNTLDKSLRQALSSALTSRGIKVEEAQVPEDIRAVLESQSYRLYIRTIENLCILDAKRILEKFVIEISSSTNILVLIKKGGCYIDLVEKMTLESLKRGFGIVVVQESNLVIVVADLIFTILKSDLPPRFSLKPALDEIAEPAYLALQAIPGVGPKTAKKVLEYFGSLKAVANAKLEELLALEGMGYDKAIRIYKVFNASTKKKL
jgi:5'-3' exonuclease